jgi:hypothetical protein
VFNSNISFEQAVRFLTLDEVLEIARSTAPVSFVAEELDERFQSADALTVPAAS